MPDKKRAVIQALVDAGAFIAAEDMLAEEDAIWHALGQELDERAIYCLIAENLACECGECGVLPPIDHITGLAKYAVWFAHQRRIGMN